MINGDARAEIMRSIRSHLAASAPYNDPQIDPPKSVFRNAVGSVVELFKQNVELVDGHCIIVRNQKELEDTIRRLTERKQIVKSDDVVPIQDLFKFEVGITRAQAGIAETGTLVLDSSVERNRLVSLVPPVHIAILNSSQIYPTLDETLAALHSSGELSPAITFITGPSRTADIELTLTVGVHGPQELYVIVNEGQTQE